MAIADDLKDLEAQLKRLVQIVVGLRAQVEAQEASALSRVGPAPRVPRLR